MTFSEKLQTLRTQEHLTQEALAEKIFVSRTAISKWESGRGYPSIDSLKAISRYFHVSVDELLFGEESVVPSEQRVKAPDKPIPSILCGILDCLTAILFFLPVFGNKGPGPVSSALPTISVSAWIRMVFAFTVGLTAGNGLCTVITKGINRSISNRYHLYAGMVLSLAGTFIFILTRQPYAGLFYLLTLVTKGFFLLKKP